MCDREKMTNTPWNTTQWLYHFPQISRRRNRPLQFCMSLQVYVNSLVGTDESVLFIFLKT